MTTTTSTSTSTPLSIMQAEEAHTSGVYPKRPLTIVRGQAAYLWDEAGRRYIDCVGGQGAANLGHCHPAVVAAIQAQATTLLNCPEIFYNDQRATLLTRLTSMAGMPRAFLCNSGAEAVEAAIKFAKLTTGRAEIIATMRGFHGRTLGALSATWEPKYREPFQPLVPHFKHVTYNDGDALDAIISDQTAAVIVEVVQGEGGVRPASADYLRHVQQACQVHGALFILDEVQTGFGRTGRLFAHQHYGLQPDLMPIAKSIAGGLPMGACLIGERLGTLPPMSHGTTFGGGPLLCAAANAALEALQREGLAERAATLGAWMIERLRRIDSPHIREVRGMGLIIGIDLRSKVTPVLRALQEHGVLALPAGATVLRLLPPLVIEQADLETVAQAIETVLNALPAVGSA